MCIQHFLLYISYTKRQHLLLYTDLDACIDVLCDYHAICKAFGPFDARCVCIDSCPSYQEPICSSNGTTYDNTCLFKQEMCLLQLNFTVQHPGSCEGTSDLVICGLYCHQFFFVFFCFCFGFFFLSTKQPWKKKSHWWSLLQRIDVIHSKYHQFYLKPV